jgi:hypothetical protein
MGESTTPWEKGMRREMMARNAKRLVMARKQLAELTPEELAEVSGGGLPFFRFRHHHHHHHHHHRFHFPFV